MSHVEPLVVVRTIYDGDWSTYPERIRVPMGDGHVATYRLETQQPHPAFRMVIDLLDKMPVYGGYKYEEKKKRRRLCRQPAAKRER